MLARKLRYDLSNRQESQSGETPTIPQICNDLCVTQNVISLQQIAYILADSDVVSDYGAPVQSLVLQACVAGTESIGQALDAVSRVKSEALRNPNRLFNWWCDQSGADSQTIAFYKVETCMDILEWFGSSDAFAALGPIQKHIGRLADELVNTYGDWHIENRERKTAYSIIVLGGDIEPTYDPIYKGGPIVVLLCSMVPGLEGFTLDLQTKFDMTIMEKDDFRFQHLDRIYTSQAPHTQAGWPLLSLIQFTQCQDKYSELYTFMARKWPAVVHHFRPNYIIQRTYPPEQRTVENQFYYAMWTRCVAAIPNAKRTLNDSSHVPILNVAEFLWLDERDQACYRDALAERHTNPTYTPTYVAC